MPNKAKNYEDCRKSVCFLCIRKGDRELNDFIIGRIHKLVKSNIKFSDERVPQASCNHEPTCKKEMLVTWVVHCLQSTTSPQLLSSYWQGHLVHVTASLAKLESSSLTKNILCDQKNRPKMWKRRIFQAWAFFKSSLYVSTNGSTQCLLVIDESYRHSCTIGTRHQNLKALVQSDLVGPNCICYH